jgi:tRNA modification GTPase
MSGVASTAVRCRESLTLAAQRLAEALAWADSRAGDELVAAAVRAAIDALGQVLGTVYTDDLLDPSP